MRRDLQDYLENRRKFLENRPKFPLAELARYNGQWIAWSPDGTRIVASSRDPDALDALVRAGGEDPEQCLVEGIADDDSVIGSSLLGEEG